MKYKSVFIDLDDTLWDFKTNARDTFLEVYLLHQFDSYFNSFEHFYSMYCEKCDELWNDYGQGKISKDELNHIRFNYPLQQVGIFNQEIAKLYAKDFFSRIPYKKGLKPFAKDILEYLSLKYKLCIVSNGFKELQFEKMKSSGIYDYFSHVFLSEDIGKPKPSSEFFDYALHESKSIPEETIMIGDNLIADIEGAKNVGIDQIYYTSINNQELPFQPTYCVQALNEIESIL